MAFSDQTHPGALLDTRHAGPLVAGDIIAFVVFAVIGITSHGEAVTPAKLLEAGFPFLAGWFVAAPWLGLFRHTVAVSPRRSAGRTALAWLIGLPIGLGLRALIIGRASPISFAVVTFIVVLVMLLGWRTTYAWLASRRNV